MKYNDNVISEIVSNVINEYKDNQKGIVFDNDSFYIGDKRKQQYYTHPKLADAIIELTFKTISHFYHGLIDVVDPCVGIGSFGLNKKIQQGNTLYNLKVNNLSLSDIDVEQFYNTSFGDSINGLDMVDINSVKVNRIDATNGQYQLISESNNDDGHIPVLYITNPPFKGVENKILNRCIGNNVDFISFILPLQYYEKSINGYKLIQSVPLPKNAFKSVSQNGNANNIRCCWNLYVLDKYNSNEFDDIKLGDSYVENNNSNKSIGTVYYSLRKFDENCKHKQFITSGKTGNEFGEKEIKNKTIYWKCDSIETDNIITPTIYRFFHSNEYKKYCSINNGFQIKILIQLLQRIFPNIKFEEIEK